MKDDTIKRKDAIGAINGWLKRNHFPEIGDGILYLVPSADKPQEWIPCSERLPNDGDRIVIQYANGDLGVINSCRIRLWNIINSPYATVVAWMPSPEPWKGESDEGN